MDQLQRKLRSVLLLCGISLASLLLLPVSLFATSVSFTYDAAGRLLSGQYGDGQTVSYAYDAVGNMTQLVSSGKGTITSFVPVIFLLLLDDSSSQASQYSSRLNR